MHQLDFLFLGLGLPQGPELLIILLIVLLIWGGAKLPVLMRNLGRGAGEFKSGLAEGKQQAKSAETDNP